MLTGDADYQCFPPGCAALGPVTHLIATHHGARFKSSAPQIPPPTMPGCTMVVSYGTRNVYRHPHIEALQVHATAGWNRWISTAVRRGFDARGDRWLR